MMEFPDALKLMQIEKECVIRNSLEIYGHDCGKCDLAQEDTDLIEAFQMAIFSLKKLIQEEGET